jgi:hypothetical protein
MDCAMSAYSASIAIQNQQLTQNQRRFVLCPDTKHRAEAAGFGVVVLVQVVVGAGGCHWYAALAFHQEIAADEGVEKPV